MTNELLCLAAAIFFEARGEPHTGQELVAEVVMNRVEHERFPDTVCGVVYEHKQFSFTHDGLSDDPKEYTALEDVRMADKSLILAQDYLDGYRLGSTSTHYHTTYVAPFWKDDFKVDGLFGDHIFYTCDEYC
jgi:spore germination cell wall hydrolase CwlJ-like protein